MYRPKGWKRKEREKEKIKMKVACHEKDGSVSVIFVPATPGSQLQKQYERQIRSERFRVRVVEKAGESLKGILQRSVNSTAVSENGLFGMYNKWEGPLRPARGHVPDCL